MRYRTLGSSGLMVSVVGLGGNNFGRRIGLEETATVVRAALDAGVTLIDTADIYGDSEVFLGDVLKGQRQQVVLATKFGGDLHGRLGPDWGARGARRYIRKAVESSLHRLQTDYIDLYQYHFPDPHTPIEETLAALDELVREGTVRYLGSSNLAGWQIVDAEWIARTAATNRFVSAQNNYNLLERQIEADVLPACERYRIGILPYFPLANGLLTGKYRRGEPPPTGSRLQDKSELLSDANFDRVEALEAFARERQLHLLDVAVGGLAAQPMVASVIAGATKPEQVRRNVAAAEWQPGAEDLAALDAITGSHRPRGG
jgi:aryl-alcohol dehydrogenase-like predicted oxidoreductase